MRRSILSMPSIPSAAMTAQPPLNRSAAPNPVVLVPGIDDTATVLQPLMQMLRQQGRHVHGLSLWPSNGDLGLDELAAQVDRYVNRTFAPHQPIDLIGFSMGGIVSRYYVQQIDQCDRVQRLVTISSPHQGSLVAYGRWNLGCHQMRPGSPFLQALNRDLSRLHRLNFTSLWTPFDLMIVPAHSSQLPVGQELTFPVLLHSWMIRDPRCLDAIATLLDEPLRYVSPTCA